MPFEPVANLLSETPPAEANRPIDLAPQIPDAPVASTTGGPTLENPASQPVTEGPGWGEIWGAAFKTENVIGSILDDDIIDLKTAPFRPGDMSFNPADHIPPGYEDQSDDFLWARSQDELTRILKQKEKEQGYRKILNTSGWKGMVAAMGASMLDPSVLLPVARVARGGPALFRTLKGTGAVGGSVAGSVAIQEFGLHYSQLDRTGRESLLNTAAASAFGGILGGMGAFLAKGAISANKAKLMDLITKEDTTSISLTPGNPDSLKINPSARVSQNPEGLYFLNKSLPRYLSGPEFLRPIGIRGLTSHFEGIQRTTNNFFEHNLILNKNIEGDLVKPVAVETLIELRMRDVINVKKDFTETYTSIVKQGNKISMDELSSLVAKAIYTDGQPAIKEVKTLADKYSALLEGRLEELQKLELLPPDLEIKTAARYFPRVPNREKILADKRGFIAAVTKSLKANNFKPESIPDAVESIYRHYSGLEGDFSAFSVMLEKSNKGNFLESRLQIIRDEDVSEYMSQDGLGEIIKYLSQSAKVIEVHKRLREMGYKDTNSLLTAIKQEGSKKISDMPDADGLTRIRLAAELDSDVKAMGTALDALEGRNRKVNGFTRGLSVLKKYNNLTLLGSVTLSSVTDLAMPILNHGVKAAIGDGWAPALVRAFNFSSKGKKFAEAQQAELADMMVGVELETNNSLRALTDPDFSDDLIRSKNRVLDTLHAGMNKAADVSNRVFLLGYWNDMNKRIGGNIIRARLIRDALKPIDTIDKKELERLAELGINKQDLKDIQKEFKAYGDTHQGSYIANVAMWRNETVAKKFQAAVLKEVNSTVITPKIGDHIESVLMPGAKGAVAGLLFQLKSFSSAATSKILLRGLQFHDTNVLIGLSTMTTLGALRYIIGEQLAGREPDTSPDKLFLEGVARSGWMGLMGDLSLQLAGHNSRYNSAGKVGAFLGPSFSTAERYADLWYGLLEGEGPTKKEMSYLIPMANTFYIRMLLNEAGFYDDEKTKSKNNKGSDF